MTVLVVQWPGFCNKGGIRGLKPCETTFCGDAGAKMQHNPYFTWLIVRKGITWLFFCHWNSPGCLCLAPL